MTHAAVLMGLRPPTIESVLIRHHNADHSAWYLPILVPWSYLLHLDFNAADVATIVVSLQEPAQFLLFSSGDRGGAALVHSLLIRAVGAPQDALKQVKAF